MNSSQLFSSLTRMLRSPLISPAQLERAETRLSQASSHRSEAQSEKSFSEIGNTAGAYPFTKTHVSARQGWGVRCLAFLSIPGSIVTSAS